MRHRICNMPATILGFRVRDTFFDSSDNASPSRRRILLCNMCVGATNSLTAGIYFTSLLLAMGASDSYIGYTTLATSISTFFQLLSPYIFEKMPRRKWLLVGARISSHILNIAALGCIPLLPIDAKAKLILFFITLSILNCINQIAAPGITAWHLQSLPTEKHVDFYAVNNVLVNVLTQATGFIAGIFLDRFELKGFSMWSLSPTLTAIILLRICAMVLAGLDCFSFFRIKEKPYETATDKHKSPGIRLTLLPLKDNQFMGTVTPSLFYAFCAGIIGQFFSIHLLENVKMSYSLISLGQIISLPMAFLFTPFWTKQLHKHKCLNVLCIAQVGYSIAWVLNAFITQSTIWIYFLCILVGIIFYPGITLSQTKLLYIRMPNINRTAYIGMHTMLTMFATFLGNTVGIQFINHTANFQLLFLGFSLCNKQYLNLLAAALLSASSLYTFTYLRKKLNL